MTTNHQTRVRHPIIAFLREEGRSTPWLAKKVGRNPNYLSQVFNGHRPAVAELRADCARALDRPENELFQVEAA